ncbi:GNAT family N-acetyltransferase [Undibacterium terreum]|uniref:N-acetyltransferase n=1 Tax=Undibacterium terreum TaxID=1224302 RepID=A0A916XKJ9_9BURK|nr:GNAT family N-acetyltransferase [Undibacterium terreum]GGC77477.1 N-acetyltransferase [Undibacterium terreum]
MAEIQLRDVIASDLPVFFRNQLDADANHMAAFTAKDPADRDAFDHHWAKIIADSSIPIQTITLGNEVIGHVLSYELAGATEVSYWISKEYWGRGLATQAMRAFLQLQTVRPLHARAAKDNIASLRVLEKCGFVITGVDRGYANARGAEIEEFVLQLNAARA